VKRFAVGAAVVALALVGCAGARDHDLADARAIAAAGGLVPERLESRGMTVLGFERAGPPGGVLTIYIEGDGRAWLNPWQPSTDPTPTDPIALRLAVGDPSRPLLYLARPCQFETFAGCAQPLWTNGRLSPEVVAVYQQLLDGALHRTGSTRLALIGYSGGGALAALLAERRRDVAWLVTVAGDLDLAAWTRLRRLAPLSGSLDPADDVMAIEALPQVHFTGADDEVVPAAVAESFLRRFRAGNAARLIVVPHFDHGCCWAASWPQLLRELRLPR
jgi:pimeloyl-ACP methyl ester carboxylesterase